MCVSDKKDGDFVSYPSTVILNPSAHFGDNVLEKPIVEFFKIWQRIIVGTDNNVTAEAEQHYDSLARNAIREEFV